jgi:hypothetical protein
MKGRYRVQVISKRLKYDFTISRNITILQGNSATGKTTLINMIAQYRSGTIPCQVICEKECYAFNSMNFIKGITDISQFQDSILFFEEDIDFVKTKEFAEIVKNSSCYFVIVRRDAIKTLPYSVESIYELLEDKKYGNVKQVCNIIGNVVDIGNVSKINLDGQVQTIITEDKNAGFTFFENIAKESMMDCISANGNGNIVDRIREYGNKGNNLLVVADGAAIGAYIVQMIEMASKYNNIILYVPESFEWVILKSGVIKNIPDLDNILETPWQYIESEKYFSWERYFTAILIESTQGTYLSYSKSKLNSAYLEGEVYSKIKDFILLEIGK